MTNSTSRHFSPSKAIVAFGKNPIAWAGAAGVTAGLLWALPASALTITQSFGINVIGSNAQTINYQKFDSSLGTLTGITFSFSGQTSGSFLLTNTSASFNYTLTSSASNQVLSWGGELGMPLDISASTSNFIASLSSSTGSNIIPKGGANSATFTLASPIATSGGPLDYLSYSSFFSGSGSVDLLLGQQIVYNANNSITPNIANLLYGGQNSFATLTYEYTPTPVPVGLPVIGAAAGYSFLRRQRRRISCPK